MEEDELLQGKFKLNNETDQNPIQQKKDDKNSSIPTDTDALAFTQDNNVHFAPGQFKPETKKGQELIGHEFAHVVQQREGKVKANKQTGKFPINDNKYLEKQADEQGKKAADGVLQRKEKDATVTNLNGEVLQKKEAEKQKSAVEEEIAIPPTKYIDEDGNLLYEINDGASRTYVIANDKIKEFKAAIAVLEISGKKNDKEANRLLGELYGILDRKKPFEKINLIDFKFLYKGEPLTLLDQKLSEYNFDRETIKKIIDYYKLAKKRKILNYDIPVACCQALYESIKIAVDIPNWRYNPTCEGNMDELNEKGYLGKKETIPGKKVYENNKLTDVKAGDILSYVRQNVGTENGNFLFALGLSNDTHIALLMYHKSDEFEEFYIADQGTPYTRDDNLLFTNDKERENSGITSVSTEDLQTKIDAAAYWLWNNYNVTNAKINVWRIKKYSKKSK